MILFIDTEWADVLASELVSLALVSDCGRYEFYAERDPLPATPTDFVLSTVYPLLDRGARALSDAEFAEALHTFFENVRVRARHGKILVAFDYRNDLDLLAYALDGFETSETRPRPTFNAFNLGLLGKEYIEAVEECFAQDPELRNRRHHALVDAHANRRAYIQTRDKQAWQLSELERLQTEDSELADLMVEVLGDPIRSAGWWTRKCATLGQSPSQAYAEGKREKVLDELHAIKHGFVS